MYLSFVHIPERITFISFRALFRARNYFQRRNKSWSWKMLVRSHHTWIICPCQDNFKSYTFLGFTQKCFIEGHDIHELWCGPGWRFWIILWALPRTRFWTLDYTKILDDVLDLSDDTVANVASHGLCRNLWCSTSNYDLVLMLMGNMSFLLLVRIKWNALIL